MTRPGTLFPPDEKSQLMFYLELSMHPKTISLQNFGNTHMSKWPGPELLPKFGYDFSAREDVDTILNAFKDIGIKENIWIGAGATSISPKPITNYLMKLVKKGDSETEVVPIKVHAWTVDYASSMRYYQQLIGSFAVIFNYSDRMKHVVIDQFKDILSLDTY